MSENRVVRCVNCDFYAHIGNGAVCNAAEPDATPNLANPEIEHSCKHWEERSWAETRRRNQATQEKVTRVQENDAAADALQYVTPNLVSRNIRVEDVRLPTREEVQETLGVMGVPPIVSTPNSEPNPFLVSEGQLAWARRIERDIELAERSREAITAEEIRLTREQERLEVERERHRQYEEARRVDELVNGSWDVSAGEPVVRGGGRSGRHRDRISVPRRWEEGVSVSELRERMKDLPPVRGVPIGQRLEIHRGLRAQNFRPVSESPRMELYDRDQVTLRFVLEIRDGAPVWIYQGQVIMD